MKLAELGEFGLIERIRRLCPVQGEGVTLGIGDDCAIVDLSPGEELLTSTDLLIEAVHFRLDWSDWRCLGRKAVSVNVSDIAAMGGVPRHLYLGLGLPATTTVEEIEALAQGIAERLNDYGMVLVGGDTCRSPGPLMLSLTVVGSAPQGESVRRSGALPGDRLYVSGTLGGSALALQRLLAGQPLTPELAQRHHDPEARVALGRGLASAGLAHAMIDLSDGLIADLGHICRASAVGARVELERLPLCADLQAAGLGGSGDALAASGGEDYELLVAIPPEKEAEALALAETLGLPLSCVGEMTTAGEDLQVIGRDGLPLALGKGGFNHFAATVP